MEYSKDFNDLPLHEDLHLRAGLVDTGLNAEGDIEWMGDKKAWEKFAELEAELNNNN